MPVNEDIYDIKPIPVFAWSPPSWVLILIAVFAVGLILFLFLRTRRSKSISLIPQHYLNEILLEVERCRSGIPRGLAHRVSLVARRFAGFVLGTDVSSLPGPKLATLEAAEPLSAALGLISQLDLIRYSPNFDELEAARISRELLKKLTEIAC